MTPATIPPMPLIRLRSDRWVFAALLAGSALLFAWGLDVSGYANSYYSAAALAGAESWKAMLFGSLDPANAITVDKPPMALWPMALSVRAFGLSSWSILLPQAVEGTATVGLLYACVRRATGAVGPALLAGAAFALMPVTVLVFRYNNPDAMLTLLLVAAACATLRALESARAGWWMALVGILSGLGFLTKMLEAFLVLPAFATTYLICARGSALRRLGHLVIGAVALVISAGWWVALVELWPPSSRPFIGGSPTNSVLELALGYNGFGRLTGSTGTTATTGGWGATNIARIGRTNVGAEIMWLLPAAIVLGVLAWTLSRGHPWSRSIRASLLLWTTWVAVATAVFAVMAGIFHSYYTVVLAPGVAALVGIGSWLGWLRRDRPWVRRVFAGTMLATTLLASGTVAAVGYELRWTAVLILVCGIFAALLLHPRSGPPRLAAAIGTLAVVAGLAGPALFAAETVRLPHSGSGPMAGPVSSPTSSALVASSGQSLAGFLGAPSYAPLSRAVVRTIASDSERYTWAAAAVGARSASAYQLALDEPVLAIGGYKGTDPAPSLGAFQAAVSSGRIHWLISGGTEGPASQAIERWVADRFLEVVVDGRTLYDLSSSRRSTFR